MRARDGAGVWEPGRVLGLQIESASKMVATAMGLAAFAIAILAGLHAGNPTTTILGIAVLCMVACHIVGLFIGSIGERVVREHVKSNHMAAEGAVAGTAAPARGAPTPGA